MAPNSRCQRDLVCNVLSGTPRATMGAQVEFCDGESRVLQSICTHEVFPMETGLQLRASCTAR